MCGKSVKCPAGDIVVLGCVGATSLLLSLPPQAKIGKQKISLEAKGPVMATTLCCIQSLARFCQPLRKIRNFVFPSMRFEFEWRAHLQLASCRTARIARCKSRFAVCEDLINQVGASGMRDMQAGMNFDAEGPRLFSAALLLDPLSLLSKSVTYHHVVSVWQMMMRFHAVVET